MLAVNLCCRQTVCVSPACSLRGTRRRSRTAGPVGRTRQRCFAGTNFKPRKLPENAPTPITLARVLFRGPGARLASHVPEQSGVDSEAYPVDRPKRAVLGAFEPEET
jgi:hypothetical protein